jgi:hypothetical protein
MAVSQKRELSVAVQRQQYCCPIPVIYALLSIERWVRNLRLCRPGRRTASIPSLGSEFHDAVTVHRVHPGQGDHAGTPHARGVLPEIPPNPNQSSNRLEARTGPDAPRVLALHATCSVLCGAVSLSDGKTSRGPSPRSVILRACSN